ncbi:MAG: GFA family protein [Shimia sp.]
MLSGACLCGDIRFRVTAQPHDASACHCTQCRKQTGHYWACAHVARSGIEIEGTPAWYSASDIARRGFCPRCGALLFWDAQGEDVIGFSLGAIDGPTGLTLERHIFTADKGDYYDIADGVRQELGED